MLVRILKIEKLINIEKGSTYFKNRNNPYIAVLYEFGTNRKYFSLNV